MILIGNLQTRLFQCETGIQVFNVAKIEWIDIMWVVGLWYFHHFNVVDDFCYRPGFTLESNKVCASPVGRLVGFSGKNEKGMLEIKVARCYWQWMKIKLKIFTGREQIWLHWRSMSETRASIEWTELRVCTLRLWRQMKSVNQFHRFFKFTTKT